VELFGTGTDVEQLEQDPKIQELTDAHQEAEKAAEKAADATVGALFVEEQDGAGTPSKATSAPKVTRSASAK
jgi:hypothetical protein